MEGEKVKRQRSDISGQTSEDRNCKNTLGNLRFRSTFDIIEAVEAGRFPHKAMITVHPQRWTDNALEWTKELVGQNVKNMVKRLMVHRRGAKYAKKRDVFLSAERPERKKLTQRSALQ